MKKSVALIITGLILTTVLLAAACAPAAKESPTGETSVSTGRAESAPAAPREEPAPPTVIVTKPGFASSEDSGQGIDSERMIVRSGDIWLVVEDVPEAVDKIKAMADSLDGYVVNSSVWKERERLIGNISIRVPVERFDEAINGLRNLAVDVSSEQTTSQDVTEEYVDLEARLSNLEASEEQLLVIMTRAETVEEILDVQRELSRVRGEIEQTKARMQYLERTSDTSIITIRLEQSKLDAELYASTTRVKEGEKIQFYSQVAGGFAPYSYQWDLGDGTITTEEVPLHSYNNEGRYTISLTVTDDRGNTASETRKDYITVLPGWSTGTIAGNAWNGLVSFGRGLLNVLIWVGVFSPVWIVIGGIAYLVIRRRRRKAR